ncbi:hypothetical protein M595_3273 [Lyngbya aestuarii BL J]|uniref:Uncharacterized protein n=1 Tax=Lyngbya aestuarii BL J TaxID=1348334 RepID=U7QJZ0_9CYAN|nr:hypothetical protein M595_3273 [Lyngbya aestuarii BL J]
MLREIEFPEKIDLYFLSNFFPNSIVSVSFVDLAASSFSDEIR